MENDNALLRLSYLVRYMTDDKISRAAREQVEIIAMKLAKEHIRKAEEKQ